MRHSPRATADLRELYRRMILNPNLDRPARLSTAIDLDDTSASIETALPVCRYFRLSEAQARTAIPDMERATSSWRTEAVVLGLPEDQVSRMADAFETDQPVNVQAGTGRPKW